MPVLVDGGPLCIASPWRWTDNSTVGGLYFIYHKVSGFHFGPYYASIVLAEKAMRKALKDIPKEIWSHEAQWYGKEQWLGKYIEEYLGMPMDLVGGEWERDSD